MFCVNVLLSEFLLMMEVIVLLLVNVLLFDLLRLSEFIYLCRLMKLGGGCGCGVVLLLGVFYVVLFVNDFFLLNDVLVRKIEMMRRRKSLIICDL